MHFANPLWFLILIPLIFWFYLQMQLPSKFRLPFPSFEPIRSHIIRYSTDEKVLLILKGLSLLLILIALARPQTVSKTSDPPKPTVDILLCLDTSLSMSALDFDSNRQNRLEAAKTSAIEFIQKRPLDRIGLVVFGGRAITQCPLTLDHESLVELLKSVPMHATQTEGTAIGTALALAASRLGTSEAKSKVIVLLTDGRSNTGNIDPVTTANSAKELGIKIYTIGTAVPGGGLIPVEHPIFGQKLVQTEEDLDEPTLKEIASVTNAKYFRVTSSERFKEIYEEIDRMEKTEVEVSEIQDYKDQYVPFLILALILLLLNHTLESTLWRSVP